MKMFKNIKNSTITRINVNKINDLKYQSKITLNKKINVKICI